MGAGEGMFVADGVGFGDWVGWVGHPLRAALRWLASPYASRRGRGALFCVYGFVMVRALIAFSSRAREGGYGLFGVFAVVVRAFPCELRFARSRPPSRGEGGLSLAYS